MFPECSLCVPGVCVRSSHTLVLMMSEWICATPLTACEPRMQRWAMFTRFPPSSSIRDIRRRRSMSSGNRDAMLCREREREREKKRKKEK